MYVITLVADIVERDQNGNLVEINHARIQSLLQQCWKGFDAKLNGTVSVGNPNIVSVKPLNEILNRPAN